MSVKNLLLLIGIFFVFTLNGQELVYQTFKDTRVINTPSTETLEAGKLDFRVAHRFGDIAGPAGGWKSFYGLETATDVGIGFDYGLTDKFMIGISRTKGSSDLRQNVNFSSKIKIMEQQVDGNPFNLALFGLASLSTMPKSAEENRINSFEKFEHRLYYHLQILLSKKVSERFSFQIGAAWTYRNLVTTFDQNDLASVSLVLKYQLSKSFGIIIDGNMPFSSLRSTENGYYLPLGIGLEWETGGGHVFQMNFTNSTGLMETDYLVNTRSNWADGGYRLGFTIARQFTLR